MKVGDKIVCIYDNRSSGLTKGEVYSIISCVSGYYIKNDWGDYGTYHTSRFISLEEHRHLKIKEIGI